jgi:hypothetical protein
MKRILVATLALTLMTGIAYAEGGHGGGGGRGGEQGIDRGPGGDLTIGTNGTVYLTRVTTDAAGTRTAQLVAISATGATLFTAALPSGTEHVELSGSNLLTVSDTRNTDGTVTSTITAISANSGATAWTKTINGHVTSLTPFSGGTYAIVVVPPATSGAAATRSLVAIGNDGSTLWTVAL